MLPQLGVVAREFGSKHEGGRVCVRVFAAQSRAMGWQGGVHEGSRNARSQCGRAFPFP